MPQEVNEDVVAAVYSTCIHVCLGRKNAKTREQLTFAIQQMNGGMDIGERALRDIIALLNQTRRVLCTSGAGHYIPLTEEEFLESYKYKHDMAIKMLENCKEMKYAWENKETNLARNQALHGQLPLFQEELA